MTSSVDAPPVPAPAMPPAAHAAALGGETAVPAIGEEVAPAAPVKAWALSPSRAGDFMTCPLLYRYRVIDRLPEPPSPVTARGTLVHAVLERLFDSPAPERTLENAIALLRPQWELLLDERPELAELFAGAESAVDSAHDLTADSADRTVTSDGSAAFETWLASAHTLLRTYFALEDPRRIEPHQRELLVEVELPDGVRLRGFVDRVDVATSGQVRIVDYKTGNAPSELFEDKALFQLKFYALTMWRASGTIPTLLQLMYLGDGQILRYAPDEADLLATERKVRALWVAIERALHAREFPPRQGRLCAWCAHQSLCPAFGGTPPTYPQSDVVVPVDAPAWSDALGPGIA